jgi:ArsR family transcriptional regulator, arsenate/arsenite/antimonite-responsive transcriptional repressor
MLCPVTTTATPATDLTRAARLFHALSDETRLAVIEMLRDGERCVCDLQTDVGAAQSRLSFHLKVLKDVGLVTDRKQGRWVHYALDRETFAELEALLTDFKPSARQLAIHTRSGASCCD